MKTLRPLLLSVSLVFAVGGRAQLPEAPAAPEAFAASGAAMLTADQLDQLVGPIALYPDALVALILPAATAPADVVLAARYLKDGGDPTAAASKSWDESVKSLAHYPAIVKWMDENLAWTKQLGEAFREQPAEVMNAVQRMRAKARAIGALTDNPQQQVVLDGDVISIVPAQPDVIYVPYYDPDIVYVRRTSLYNNPFFTFSAPFAVGAWLSFDCDWRSRTVWTVDRHWTHPGHRDWRHPIFPGQPGYVNDPNRHPWRPANNFPASSYANVNRPPNANFRPAPNANPPAPRPDFDNHRNDGRWRGPDGDRPNVVATATVPVGPAPAVAPPPSRRINWPHQQNNSEPVAQNYPAPAPQPAPSQPHHFPYGAPPTSPVVAPITGPVVAPISRPVVQAFTGPVAASPAPTPAAPAMHFPTAAAPPPPPPPAPAQQSPEQSRRNIDGERKPQPN